jgi:hypothetical protein
MKPILIHNHLLNKNKKNNKHMDTCIEDYIDAIYLKGEKNMPYIKNVTKINEDDVTVPTIYDYEIVIKYNYNIQQLKQFAKYYKLKIGGNKKELVRRIYLYLYLSSYLIKIQKRFRGLLQRKYNEYHGQGLFKRQICTNENDFITMEELEKIPYYNFFSYKDTDGFIYGFDIRSLYNLWIKASTQTVHNPYNRSVIPLSLLANIRRLCKIGRILKNRINLKMEDDTQSVAISYEKIIEIRAITLFQNIDSLGNYSNANWFLALNRLRLLQFVNKLYDVWNYRAQLPYEIKIKVCPPHGNPFRNINLQALHNPDLNILTIQKILLEIRFP